MIQKIDNTSFQGILTPASGIPRLDTHTPGACTAAEACRRDKLRGNRSPCCNTDRHTVQWAGLQTETENITNHVLHFMFCQHFSLNLYYIEISDTRINIRFGFKNS